MPSINLFYGLWTICLYIFFLIDSSVPLVDSYVVHRTNNKKKWNHLVNNGQVVCTRLPSRSLASSKQPPADNNDNTEACSDTGNGESSDCGAAVTDRFKYKVKALLGAFDPDDKMNDNERYSGNILNAMIDFPCMYSFHVVGKTNGEIQLQDRFVDQVRAIVGEGSGDDPKTLPCLVTPRGKTYTKVTVQAQVGSAVAVATIYKDLQQLESLAMLF